MEAFDGRFPGFEHDNHGVEIECDSQGRPTYKVYVVKQ
jgi:lysine decarboxylase/arginine decarboxylase